MVAATPSETQRLEFRNSYGELFVLEVDVDRETGVLTSTEFDDVAIESDMIQEADVILAADEFAFVAGSWREVFGRELREPPFNTIVEVCQKLQQELGEDGPG